MKKLNNKGVSLAEVLASITILGIVVTSTIFAVNSRAMQLKILNDEFTIKFKLTDASNRFFLTGIDSDESPLYGEHIYNNYDNLLSQIRLVKNDYPNTYQAVVDLGSTADFNKKYLLSYIKENDREYYTIRDITLAPKVLDEYRTPDGTVNPDTLFKNSIEVDNIPEGAQVAEPLRNEAKLELIAALNNYFNYYKKISSKNIIDNKKTFEKGYTSSNQLLNEKITKVEFNYLELNYNKVQRTPQNENKRIYSYFTVVDIYREKNTPVAIKIYGDIDVTYKATEVSSTKTNYVITPILISEGTNILNFQNKPGTPSSTYYDGYHVVVKDGKQKHNIKTNQYVVEQISNVIIDFINGTIDPKYGGK